MRTGQMLIFAPFRLDPVNTHLWRAEELVSLRPKPFAVLRYLVENPGRLVTKEELTKAVWPDTYVGESSLKGYIRDLREVLADDSQTPRFIETVARRGYRFIAKVVSSQHPLVSSDKAKSSQLATGNWQLHSLVERPNWRNSTTGSHERQTANVRLCS